MTREQLEAKTKKELARLAKRNGLRNWHEMSKAELVKSLVKAAKATTKSTATPAKSTKKTVLTSGRKAQKSSAVAERRNGHSTAERRNGHSAVAATLPKLESKSKRDLELLAKKRGVEGWQSMRKEQIIAALQKSTRSTRSKVPAVQAAARRTSGSNGHRGNKYLSNPAKDFRNGTGKDRILALVRDPFWLHVYWELTQAAIGRTEAALGQDWYNAKPILRLLDVSADDTTSASESFLRDIEIHGGVNNWYIDVQNPPGTYRVDIGYLTERGRFFVLARSNVISTPKPGASDQIDTHWQGVQEDSDRIFSRSSGPNAGAENVELRSLFDERLRRPMSTGTLGDYGSGALGNMRRKGFHFQLDAELIVYGSTDPSARVTLLGEPVQVRPDGTFTLRFGMPDGRQILPAVAQTYDGIEERTIILAVERNTKELEPMVHDGQD